MQVTIPPLPQVLGFALPFVTWAVVDFLKTSKLPKWGNDLIALLVPLLLAVLWAWLSGALAAPLSVWPAIIVASCYAIMALPEMAKYRQWLASQVSPLAVFASHHAVPQPAIRRASLQNADLRYHAMVPRYHTTMPSVPPTSYSTAPLPATPAPETGQAATIEEEPQPPAQS